jgi:hypothetical protein
MVIVLVSVAGLQSNALNVDVYRVYSYINVYVLS